MRPKTGKTRFTTRNRSFSKPLIVLQVQTRTPACVSGTWKYYWRDATVEDMTDTELDIQFPNSKNG